MKKKICFGCRNEINGKPIKLEFIAEGKKSGVITELCKNCARKIEKKAEQDEPWSVS